MKGCQIFFDILFQLPRDQQPRIQYLPSADQPFLPHFAEAYQWRHSSRLSYACTLATFPSTTVCQHRHSKFHVLTPAGQLSGHRHPL